MLVQKINKNLTLKLSDDTVFFCANGRSSSKLREQGRNFSKIISCLFFINTSATVNNDINGSLENKINSIIGRILRDNIFLGLKNFWLYILSYLS